MILSRRQWLLGLPSAAVSASDAPQGRVAFHYEASFPAAELRWYTRFATLVTGGILSPDQTRALRVKGSRLVAYHWSSAFYDAEPAIERDWQSQVRRRGQWLLSESPVGGAAAAPGRTAYWYDFGNPELRESRAKHLQLLLDSSGYDGLFFDTIGADQVPASLRAEFQRRWPKLNYNQCQGEFLAALRRLIGPNRIIFTNQGFRDPQSFLPHADMDLTESYFTATTEDNRGTRFRPWHDVGVPWKSIRTPMEQLLAPAAERFPKVRFVHVNYARGSPELVSRAVRYSWAIAKLWGHDSYLMAPGAAAMERDEIYFHHPGVPRGAGPVQQEGPVVWGSFAGGIVAVNIAKHPVRLKSRNIEVPSGPDGFFFPAAAR